MDNWATTPFGYRPSTAFLPVQPYCVNARRNRCQEDLNSCPLGELDETTRTPSHYVKTIQQDLKSNNLSLYEANDVPQNRPL